MNVQLGDRAVLCCPKCGYTFSYNGSGIYTTNCPKCGRAVSLRGV